MEEERVIIAKMDKYKNRLNIKVRRKVKNNFAPNDYFKVVNLKDFNDLALLFEDLDMILGAPVDKAFRRYKEKKDKGFPF
jgi:hypothetical protein